MPQTGRRWEAWPFPCRAPGDGFIKYELPGVTLQSDTSYLDREYEDFNDITQGLESEFSGGTPFLPG